MNVSERRAGPHSVETWKTQSRLSCDKVPSFALATIYSCQQLLKRVAGAGKKETQSTRNSQKGIFSRVDQTEAGLYSILDSNKHHHVHCVFLNEAGLYSTFIVP